MIVGAGGAGLSLSLVLLQQGIQSLLIERRPDISVYPRARNLNFRTFEVFRGLGLEAAIRAAGAKLSQVVVKATLASSQEQTVDPLAGLEFSEQLSPEPFAWHCPQSRFEPNLLAAAQERGGDVRYNAELASFTQDNDGVTATLVDRATGDSYMVRADYLIAADGAHSHIRQTLGISTDGVGVPPEYAIFVYFRAPWQYLIAGLEADALIIKNPDAAGIFLVAKDDLGMFLITYRPSETGTAASFTAEHCRDLVEKAIGSPDMPVEIVDIVHWQPAEAVAAQFQAGRVVLVGDAAHTMPAYKGLGVNSAIQSAQPLAWKLAAVIHGRAGAGLLGTYHADRHPVGRFAARQSLTGPAAQWLVEGNQSRKSANRTRPSVLLSHRRLPVSLRRSHRRE